MLLSCRILDDVSGVNSYEYSSQLQITEGDTPDIYIQLINNALNRPDQGFVPSGRRYCPSGTTSNTLSVTLDNIDDAKKYTKTATQPFDQDKSIWKITLTSSDKIRGTVGLKLTLTETSGATVKTTKGLLQSAIGVTSLTGV